MLNDSTLICFAATCDAEASLAFYRDVLGLRLVEDGPFALVFDANGTMLRIQKFADHVPLRNTTLGWRVRDIRAKVRQLKDAGVAFERYASLAQDEAGIWHSPSGAYVAWMKDPDGNILSLTQFQD